MTITHTDKNLTSRVEDSFTVGGVQVKVDVSKPYISSGQYTTITSGSDPYATFDRVAVAHRIVADYLNSDVFAEALKRAQVDHRERVEADRDTDAVRDVERAAMAVKEAQERLRAAQKKLAALSPLEKAGLGMARAVRGL